MSCMRCLSKCFCPKKLVLPQKIPSCAPVISNLTFHPNFHPNILIFVNLPIYRKLIHDNISLVFWKPKPFCLALFWRRYKIVCTYKHLHYKLWLVLLWRRYVLFLVINIGIIISVSVILKKIKFIFIPIYLHCCNIPKGYSSNSSKISDYINIVEITVTQHYTRVVYNRFPEQKMLENDRMEIATTEVTSIWRYTRGFSTWRTDRYFAEFESRIHIEISTSNRCHNFHVDSPFKIDVISTNFPRGISTSIRWRIDENVSIGQKCYIKKAVLK